MTKKEMNVLNILWGSKEPMTSTEIMYAGGELSQSTVNIVLKKLLSANLVEIAGIAQRTKTLSHAYRPTKASKQFVVDYLLEELHRCESIVTLDDLLQRQQG